MKNKLNAWIRTRGLFIFLICLSMTALSQAAPPIAPSEFYVYECIMDDGFEFRWTDNSLDEDGFILERSPDGVNFTVRATFLADSFKSYDQVSAPGRYWYRIRAFKGTEYSDSSNVLDFYTMWQPIYFTLYTIDTQKATIEWFDRSSNEDGYLIERSDDGGLTYHEIVKRPTANFSFIPGAHSRPDSTKFFIDDNNGAGLPLGVLYHYRVRGYIDGVGMSPYARPGHLTIGPGLIPNPPTIGVTLTNESSNGLTPTAVKIGIGDLSNNEKRFEVERSENNVDWTYVGGCNWSTGEKVIYDRTNIQPGHEYFYRAYSSNDIGKSAYAYPANSIRVPDAPPSGNTEWYVWKGASGQKSGESWANAWRDVDEINWVPIKPGHTLYLSGDSYDKGLSIFAAGVEGNPVHIKTGKLSPNPVGHDGMVVVKNIYLGPIVKWLTVDGSKEADFEPFSALETPANINLKVANATSHGIYQGVGSSGLNIRFVEVAYPTATGLYLNGNPIDYAEIYGCYIHHTGEVGLGINGASTRSVYDAIKVRKNLIEYTADDCMQIGATAMIDGNIMRYNNTLSAGHADGIQTVSGNYLQVSNNIIADRSRSSYFFVARSASSGVHGHWRVFNNLFYYSNKAEAVSTEGVYMSAMSLFEPGGEGVFIPEVSWTDIMIANNTFVNMWRISVINAGKRAEVGKVNVSNYVVKNNLIFNCSREGTPISLKGSAASGIVYTSPGTLQVASNIVAGDGKKIEYMGTAYTPEDLNTTYGFQGNTSQPPVFKSYEGHDYSLSPLDTVARDSGSDLAILNVPGLEKDILGNYRGSDGKWDIGAYEFCEGPTCVTPPLRTTASEPVISFSIFKTIFNPKKDPPLMIRFKLLSTAHVSLRIYDRAGTLVRTLMDEERMGQTEDQQTTWDGKNAAGTVVASGIYVFQLQANATNAIKKVVVVK